MGGTDFLDVSNKYLLVYDIIRRKNSACSIKLTGLPYDVKNLSPNDIEAFFGYLVQLNKEKKGERYIPSQRPWKSGPKNIVDFQQPLRR